MDEQKKELTSDMLNVIEAGSKSSEKSINRENYDAKWIDNNGLRVEKVFGLNKNAELINGRVAMFGFLMMIITELIFRGDPVTHNIFGIN